MNRTAPILVIGNVTRDIVGDGERLGGSAAFIARVLGSFKMNVALVTRAPNDPLLKPLVASPHIRLHLLPSQSFTTFRHRLVRGRRQLRLESCAAGISIMDIPVAWRSRPLVFLVPVMGECRTELLTDFQQSEVIVSAQGWLRSVDKDNLVIPCSPPEALLAARLLAVTISAEDHPKARTLARRMARHCKLVALTRGEKAVTLFEKKGENDIPIKAVAQALHNIGAGDVFTALLGLHIFNGHAMVTAVKNAARGASRFVAEGMTGIGARPRL